MLILVDYFIRIHLLSVRFRVINTLPKDNNPITQGGFTMKLNYNVTGENRKQMVAVISQMAGVRPVYTRMPECAFLIGNIKVSKTGEMIWDERTDEELIGKVMEALSAVGFKADKSFRNILLPMLSHIFDV